MAYNMHFRQREGGKMQLLPLMFTGHSVRMHVSQEQKGGWHVATEIDGRLIGWEHCVTWRAVEQLQRRMQGWLSEAERTERRRYAA
jgi:hypothetical protein